ncbi:acetyltransferase [Halobacillus faecis]|uniref:Acetyltransferase n=1 Tax=Halobacillus faecis TaxID=360184 RepID=A0A511WVF0_9BACI|nr:acetyltransferase [Halobacillus faecis]
MKAVIEGNNPGRIYVDDPDCPKSGLIWLGNHDGFFFIGDEENEGFNKEMNDFIDQEILPEAKKLKINHFIAIGHHSRWEKTIETIFENRDMKKSNQNVYQMEKRLSSDEDEPSIREDDRVFKMSKELYDNKGDSLDNIEFLRSKLLEFWTTPEDFFQKGFGYGVIYKNRIVSLCFSGFVAENVHGIDIETLEDHQGKKLGQIAAHRFVKECVRKEMIPYWDCEEANKPSNAIAENIGLEKSFEYMVYIFPIQ